MFCLVRVCVVRTPVTHTVPLVPRTYAESGSTRKTSRPPVAYPVRMWSARIVDLRASKVGACQVSFSRIHHLASRCVPSTHTGRHLKGYLYKMAHNRTLQARGAMGAGCLHINVWFTDIPDGCMRTGYAWTSKAVHVLTFPSVCAHSAHMHVPVRRELVQGTWPCSPSACVPSTHVYTHLWYV